METLHLIARGHPRLSFLLVLAILATARPARAVMDIGDRGPTLDAGNFGMRVTNVGVLGNAFFNTGLSFDPSFEFPRGSGHEALGHAELWVGARRADGTVTVSGGPMLEWRPTLDPNDVVVTADAGGRGTRSAFDDDGDGRIDEETLNARDDDGDGEADEDLAFPAQKTCAADYVDDRPEAVNYVYPTGEQHRPLDLTVHQEAYCWTVAGFQKVAGIEYTITNHGAATLADVRLGLYADLDSRVRASSGGHLNDRVVVLSDRFNVHEGTSTLATLWIKDCFTPYGGEVPVVADGSPTSGLPWSAALGLSHTTDPLGFLTNHAFPTAGAAQSQARAPRRDTTFRYSVFAQDLPPRQGGSPILDSDRYAALAGEFPTASIDPLHDYAVLVSCGPFASLAPGQSVKFAVALVAAESQDSLVAAMQSARLAYRGARLNALADRSPPTAYTHGETGINGHEICYEPPPGIVFSYDPHCPEKFIRDPAYAGVGVPPLFTTAVEVSYGPGHCVWSDFDCDACTGIDGIDTVIPWRVTAATLPQPTFIVTPGDRDVRIIWDNLPEILTNAGVVLGSGWTFAGYRLYRLADWRRESLLPPTRNWQMIASFATDTLLGSRLLSSVTDSTVDWDYIAYGRRHYPAGRYVYHDTQVINGFDYHYVLTSVGQRTFLDGGNQRVEQSESPFRTVFSDRVTPQLAASDDGGKVWVVPNPYYGHAGWERPPVPGDVFTRHIDFFGLPRSRSTIRIYTLAGDFVAQVDHDGTTGDGQASWDLISRNGQDVESGVYLFTVDSSAGHSIGKFVLIR